MIHGNRIVRASSGLWKMRMNVSKAIRLLDIGWEQTWDPPFHLLFGGPLIEILVILVLDRGLRKGFGHCSF